MDTRSHAGTEDLALAVAVAEVGAAATSRAVVLMPLAWKLALVIYGHADPALLDSYEAERRPIATKVLRPTSTVTPVVVGDTTLARMLRNHVFLPALNLPVVQRLI